MNWFTQGPQRFEWPELSAYNKPQLEVNKTSVDTLHSGTTETRGQHLDTLLSIYTQL